MGEAYMASRSPGMCFATTVTALARSRDSNMAHVRPETPALFW